MDTGFMGIRQMYVYGGGIPFEAGGTISFLANWGEGTLIFINYRNPLTSPILRRGDIGRSKSGWRIDANSFGIRPRQCV